MVSAKEAKEWGPQHLKGLIDTMYTPYTKNNDIDTDALRKLVRTCLVDLKGDGTYATGTVSEFWALTQNERNLVAETIIDEAQRDKPKSINVICCTDQCAKNTVEYVKKAEDLGYDVAILLTPYMEADGEPGVYRYIKYVADRTNIALSLYNSGATGYVLSPKFIADVYNKIPAVVALKNGTMNYNQTNALHAMVPNMVIWECDLLAAGPGGMMWAGLASPVIMGSMSYFMQSKKKMVFREYWDAQIEGKFDVAIRKYYETGVKELNDAMMATFISENRPGYFSHNQAAYKYYATLMGYPTGDGEWSRPPQLPDITDKMKAMIKGVLTKWGII